MSYASVVRFDKTGVGREFVSPKQRCSNDDCREPLKPIFKSGRTAETWFWHECDECSEPYCDGCAETDEDGYVECVYCYSARAAREALTKGTS